LTAASASFSGGTVRFAQFISVTWLALMCALAPVHAEKRVALVIGNDRYATSPTMSSSAKP
jgi:hypothetical protein